MASLIRSQPEGTSIGLLPSLSKKIVYQTQREAYHHNRKSYLPGALSSQPFLLLGA